MRRSSSPRRKGPTLTASGKVFLLAAGLTVLAGLFYTLRPQDLTSQGTRAQTVAVGLLRTQGVRPDVDLRGERTRQRQEGRARWSFVEQRYRVRADFAWAPFRKSLESALKQQRLTLARTERENRQGTWVYHLEVSRGSALLYRLILEQPKPAMEVSAAPSFPKGKGKIAIVLDDWGYSLQQVPALKSIRQPLTISILPALPHSSDVAKVANAQGDEVILHLPMEAQDPHAPREAGTILTSMPKREVIQRLNQSLATVPYVKGINNHQGSKATADRALMKVVLGEIKQRNLYFLDSLVTSQSVCGEVARGLKLKFATRSVFLDNAEDPAAIRGRLAHLASVASEKGYAIGIGHDRPTTLEVLQASLPALEKAGYELVPVSELVKSSE